MGYSVQERRSIFKVYGMIAGAAVMPFLGNWLFRYSGGGDMTRTMVWYQVNIGTWDGGEIFASIFLGAVVGYLLGSFFYKQLAAFFKEE